jgi:hypothetical protein
MRFMFIWLSASINCVSSDFSVSACVFEFTGFEKTTLFISVFKFELDKTVFIIDDLKL